MQERLLLLSAPEPKRGPSVMRGSAVSLPWQRGRAPEGALEVDTRRPCLLGNMAKCTDNAVAAVAYTQVLEGVSVQRAYAACGVDPVMASTTSIRKSPERLAAQPAISGRVADELLLAPVA